MTSLLHMPITSVGDETFQSLVTELYHCVDWRRDDAQFPTLFYLISAIRAQDPKALSLKYLPIQGGTLQAKVGKLPGGVLWDLCFELAELQRTPIEAFDGKTVLALLKSTVAKPPLARKPSRNRLRHEAVERTIRQRRANGDL
jgi:hypothetical protein